MNNRWPIDLPHPKIQRSDDFRNRSSVLKWWSLNCRFYEYIWHTNHSESLSIPFRFHIMIDKVIPIPIKKNINHVIPLKSHYINPIRIIHVLFQLYHHCHVLAWRHLRPRPPCLRSNSQASVLNERNGGVNNNGSTQPKNGWNMDEIRMK